MHKKLLITGASGYLGGTLVLQALSKFDIFAQFNQHKPLIEQQNLHWIQFNLTDTTNVKDVVSKFRPDIVIHCAALSNVDTCEKNPELAFAVNSHSTQLIAETCKEIKCRCIYISTDIVFDGENPPYDESSLPEPIQIYGKSKLEGELHILDASPDYLVVRPSVIYGSKKLLGSNFAVQLLNQIEEKKTVQVFRDQFRSPVSVKWLANSLLCLATTSVSGIVHLAGNVSVSREEFAIKLLKFLGRDVSLLQSVSFQGKLEAKRPRDVSLNIEKAKKLLKDNPPLSLEEGFELEWLDKTHDTH